MLYLIILILIIVILFLVLRIVFKERGKAEEKVETGGLCGLWFGKKDVTQKNLQKILEFLQEKGRVTNSEIQELLGVADRTAVNYMDKLEKQGKVRQVGKTGRWTYYELK